MGADHQGPGDILVTRQVALHASERLSPELCGMAHLPGDGKRRAEDEGRATEYLIDHDPAEGSAGHELVSGLARTAPLSGV